MPRRYLVTGGAGFIGSHVTEALLSGGDEVVVLDNFNDYYDPGRKRANIDEVVTSTDPGARLRVIEGDIRADGAVNQAFTDEIDSVIHLAAMAGVRASIEDPRLYYDVNVSGTLRLAQRASSQETPPVFVLASTSSVYGATDAYPFVESDPCDRPLVPYSASKRAAEMMGYWFHNVQGMDFTVLRFFTVYGPRGRPDMMAYKVADSVTKGETVPLYNGGEMYRDWTYISDTVAGVIAAGDKRLGYEAINLGRGEPVHLGRFVRLVETALGGKATLQDLPMPVGDVPKSHADTSKARQLLDYSPTVSIDEGVQRFVQWYRESDSGVQS